MRNDVEHANSMIRANTRKFSNGDKILSVTIPPIETMPLFAPKLLLHVKVNLPLDLSDGTMGVRTLTYSIAPNDVIEIDREEERYVVL